MNEDKSYLEDDFRDAQDFAEECASEACMYKREGEKGREGEGGGREGEVRGERERRRGTEGEMGRRERR